MVEKGIRGGICCTIHQYLEANKKYIKNHDKNKESSYLRYWDMNNLHGQAMSQKLPVGRFDWLKETCKYNNDFIKSYNKDKGYFFKLMFSIHKNCMNFMTIYRFYLKE